MNCIQSQTITSAWKKIQIPWSKKLLWDIKQVKNNDCSEIQTRLKLLFEQQCFSGLSNVNVNMLKGQENKLTAHVGNSDKFQQRSKADFVHSGELHNSVSFTCFILLM